MPIPIVHCPDDGEVPVPYDELPLELPELKGADLKPKGVSPLAAADDWVNVDCPQCGGPAKRDSDTMDTFVDSSWYFLRYCSPRYEDGPFDEELVRRWMPTDIYIGGVEHAVLHLLYARFFTKVLHDMGMIDFVEPFSAQLNQGFVINQGKKMSKSLGNGVSLGDQLAEFGVDAVRLTLVFAGPPEDDIDWAEMSPAGSLRFLKRAWRLSGDVTSEVGLPAAGGDPELRKVTHHTVHEAEGTGRGLPVQRDGRPRHGAGQRHPQGDRLRLRSRPTPPCARPTEAVAILLSLVAPYTAEEMWERLGHQPTVARAQLARRRRGAAGAGVRDRGRPDPGQGQGAAGGLARTSPRTTWRPRRWPTRRYSGRWTAARSAR